jgi:hypothetical protein
MKKDLSQQEMENVRGGAVTPFWVSLLKPQLSSNPQGTKAAWESDFWCGQNPDDPHCRPKPIKPIKPVKPMPPMQTMRYPSDSDSDKVTF